MTKPFCEFLTGQLRIEYGTVKPCCFFSRGISIDELDKLPDYQNYLKQIQSWVPDCNVCRLREEVGIESPRQLAAKNPAFTDANNQVVSLQLQFDDICNAACLICGPQSSTTWQKYLNNTHLTNHVIKITKADQSQLSTEILSKLKPAIDFNKLKSIAFLGGEPLLTNIHHQFLNEIPNPADVILRYTTNVSCKPNKELLFTWSKFKQVKILLSIDGTSTHHNYLRWPLRWDTLEDNLRFMISRSEVNLEFSGSFTVTPFSAFYYDRYSEWAKSFFSGTNVNYQEIFSRPWASRNNRMEISAIPQSLINEIESKYGPSHVITNLLEPHNSEKYRELIEYIDFHDRHRQLNWRDVFPEIQHHFK